MMRMILFASLLLGCSTSPLGNPAPVTVRERLATPTRLLVAAGASTGVITVGHHGDDGTWQTSRVTLPIESGAVTATLDEGGRVVVTDFSLGLAPLALPGQVDTQLTHVHLALSATTTAATTWRDDDTAVATASVPLALSWELTVDGASSPLGDQAFPAVPLGLALDGDGATVAGTVTIAAPGTVWSWASLVELDDLSLTLAASTTD